MDLAMLKNPYVLAGGGALVLVALLAAGHSGGGSSGAAATLQSQQIATGGNVQLAAINADLMKTIVPVQAGYGAAITQSNNETTTAQFLGGLSFLDHATSSANDVLTSSQAALAGSVAAVTTAKSQRDLAQIASDTVANTNAFALAQTKSNNGTALDLGMASINQAGHISDNEKTVALNTNDTAFRINKDNNETAIQTAPFGVQVAQAQADAYKTVALASIDAQNNRTIATGLTNVLGGGGGGIGNLIDTIGSFFGL